MLPGAGGNGDAGMGATENVGSRWGVLLWGWRVIGVSLGAGSYKDVAIGVPPAYVPMLNSPGPAHRGTGVTSTAPTPEWLRRPIPAPCQGSWRVPTARPGCHDNGRRPALLLRYRDSSTCSGNREIGRGRFPAAHPPAPHPCSKHCSLLHPSQICCSFTCHLFAPMFWGLPAFFWLPSGHLQSPFIPTISQHPPGKCPLAQGLGSLSPVSASAWST